MEVLAWAAGVENDARVERRRLGMAKRMAEGRVVLGNPIFGYDYSKETGLLTINEAEAATVRQIWHWYGEDMSRYEIQRRLRASGTPQRHDDKSTRRKFAWSVGVIDGIIKRDSYGTGIFTHKLNGETFTANIPKIVCEADYQAVVARRKRWKGNPAGNIKTPNLLATKIYCQACGVTMGVRRRARWGNEKNTYIYYNCNARQRRSPSDGCCKAVRLDWADSVVWGELWAILTQPGRFEEAIKQRAKELKAEEVNAEAEIDRIQAELDSIVHNRQMLIGWALEGKISEDDLPYRLEPYSTQEKALKQELRDRQLLIGNQAGELMGLIDLLRQQVQDDLKALHPDNVPASEEEAQVQHKIKQRIVDALVKRVLVLPDKGLRIECEAGLSDVEGIRDDSLLNNIAVSESH